jgi:hypothetical protein
VRCHTESITFIDSAPDELADGRDEDDDADNEHEDEEEEEDADMLTDCPSPGSPSDSCVVLVDEDA